MPSGAQALWGHTGSGQGSMGTVSSRWAAGVQRQPLGLWYEFVAAEVGPPRKSREVVGEGPALGLGLKELGCREKEEAAEAAPEGRSSPETGAEEGLALAW